MPDNSFNNSARMFLQNYPNNEYSTEIAPGVEYGGKYSGMSSNREEG